MDRVYLDCQNQSRLRAEVLLAMEGALKLLGNPSSFHAEGREAAQALEKARTQVAALVGAQAGEVVFTSSGTEANAWALTGLTKANETRGRQIVVSAIEHLSILQMTRRMEKEGWKVTVVPVDRAGRVDPERVERALTPETVLVSVQWANAEVGTIQPMEGLVARVRSRGILVHSDAVAAAGQVPIDVGEIPVDALSLAANTLGGPAGVGALFVRKGVRILPLFVGGTQEDGRRAGSENLVGVVGMGEAAALSRQEMPTVNPKLISLRDNLIQDILNRIPEASLQGHPTQRLPGHTSFSFPGVDAETLVLALDLEGMAVGMGSACTAKTMKASHVLRAMGVEESRASGTIMLTLDAETTQADIDRVREALAQVVARQQRKEVIFA